MSFGPAPAPKSLLGCYRQLAPSAAVRVSPLCLGGMSFGTAWDKLLGSCDKATTYEILDYFKSQGGNFVDTASNYQDDESETWIGDWMKERGNRDEMVIATKFTTPWVNYKGHEKIIQNNFGGNNAKSMRVSVEASLKKLKTDYIDLLYLHWWDFTTSIPELMHALNDLVVNGKVIYLAVSDTPAWIVSKANEYARGHSLRPFTVYQGCWSAAQRDFEREIIPMCRSEGMGLAPWGTLGGGNFKTAAQREQTEGRKMGGPSEAQLKVSEVLERIGERKSSEHNSRSGSTKKDFGPTAIALAYVMHKAPYVTPIVGCRKLEHLKGNIDALSIQLSAADMKEIDSASPFDLGFPNNFLIASDGQTLGHEVGPSDIFLMPALGRMDFVAAPEPVRNGLHEEEIEEARRKREAGEK